MKNFFSKKLYIEALRQIRLPFALLFTLIAGGTGFITFVNVFSAIYDYKQNGAISFIYVSDALCLLMFTFIIAVPVFTFKLFKFLTKRNASDFYHAIPYTRNCILTTYTVAITTAIAVILLVSALIPIITYALTDKYISFNYFEAFPYVLNIFVCSLLTMCICILASSMTGTLFTGLLFALAIMFGPRAIILSMTETITNNLYELISSNYDFGIFNRNTNLIFSEFISFIDWSYTNMYKLSFSTVYTFALAIFYLILAYVAFNKRKSEQAENTGRNPIAQHTMRIALGFFFFQIALVNSYYYSFDLEFDLDWMFEIGLLIIIGISAMIIFELVTTKKARNLKYCLFSLPAVIVLCIISYSIITITSNSILNFKPTADDLDSVQYITIANDHDMFDAQYFEMKASEVKITNKEIIEMLSTAYGEGLEAFNSKFQTELHYMDTSDILNKFNRIKIQFNDGLKSEIRYVYLNDDEQKHFFELLNNDEAYSAVYHCLPDKFEAQHCYPYLSQEETDVIIKALKSEYKDIPVDILAESFEMYTSTVDTICSIDCITVENSSKYYFSIAISPKLPKTYEAFVGAMKERNQNNKTDIDYLVDLAEHIEDYYSDNEHANINLEIYDLEQKKNVCNFEINSYTKQEIDECYYEYGYKDYEELKNDFSSFIKNSSSEGRYIVFASSSCYSGDEYKNVNTVFFSDNSELIDKISTYNPY